MRICGIRFPASLTGLCGVVLAAGLAASAWAADWPQWRGPNRDGISSETGLIDSFPEDGPPLVFEAKGIGAGLSSVAVVNGRIYTMGGKGGQSHIICLQDGSGETLWSTPIGGGGETNCTPVVDGDRVYGLTKSGQLACVAAEDGKIIWQKSFSDDFGGKMMSGWGYSETPLVDGDRLICTPGSADAAIAALDKRTGDVIWSCQVGSRGKPGNRGAGYSSVVISHGAGVKQYVQLVGNGVIGVAADDGRLLWHYGRVANGTANIPTPIIDGDYVFCSSGYNTGAALLKLSADGDDGVQAEEIYFLEARTFQNHHGGMILLDGHIYAGHGHNNGFPICVEMKTGDVAWSAGRGAGTGSAAIAAADGKLFFRYQNGVMAMVEATPEEYRLLGSFEIPGDRGPSWPHPAIANGKLYLRVQERLLCYDIKK